MPGKTNKQTKPQADYGIKAEGKIKFYKVMMFIWYQKKAGSNINGKYIYVGKVNLTLIRYVCSSDVDPELVRSASDKIMGKVF